VSAASAYSGLFDRLVAGVVPYVPQPLVRRFGEPYVAGLTLEDALRTAAELAADQLLTTVDVLGENVIDAAGARAAADAYLATLDAFYGRGLTTHLSCKPSGLGSLLGWPLATEQLERVVAHAEELGAFVRIDMEDASTTDATLALYRELRAKGYERLGIVLQSRLWRSVADAEALASLRPNVRLCKGIYLEPPHIAMSDRDAIRASFSRLLRRLLRAGSYVAIATHDEELVVDALEAIDELEVGPDGYEFQTLLGVRADLARLLARTHRMRVYVPYGSDSFAYAQRRLRENPQLAGYVARDVLRELTRALHLSR
jgi:proline dehydrogenase